ncbi:MAG: 50S ribosomal protein L18 [Patescibacteria group bacterium]|nr:50S ribosomal protein L18 [Patescibacteria group bacterium]
MQKQKLLNKVKGRRKQRVRLRIRGTSSKPRLSVFRSNSHIYAQLIDDTKQKTLASASSFELEASTPRGNRGPSRGVGKKLKKTEVAEKVGKVIAEKAKKLNIKSAVLDRGAYRYHGRVKFLTEGAREEGLKI